MLETQPGGQSTHGGLGSTIVQIITVHIMNRPAEYDRVKDLTGGFLKCCFKVVQVLTDNGPKRYPPVSENRIFIN